MPRPKIAMIGAGSLIFCKTLTMDILATKALQDSEICLMNRTKPKLDKMEAFVKGVVKENKLPAKVTATATLTWSPLARVDCTCWRTSSNN